MKHHTKISVVALLACASLRAQAPTASEDIHAWLMRRAAAILNGRYDQPVILENGRGFANQNESTSSEGGSTSLVDQSSTSDFASLALNLAGLRQSETATAPKSGSVTVTAYSILAAAKGKRLLDPLFYQQNTGWRRVSFTIGTEESKLDEHLTDKPATNLGMKFVFKNDRDVYSGKALTAMNELRATFGSVIVGQASLSDRIQRIVFETLQRPTSADYDKLYAAFIVSKAFANPGWAATWTAFVGADTNGRARDEIETLLSNFSRPLERHTVLLREKVHELQQAPQWAIALSSKQREENGVDEYRAELIFDKGLSTRANWSLNGSFDFRDFQTTRDTRAGRLATEFQFRLYEGSSTGLMPGSVVLSGSGEHKAGNGMKPITRGQAKLVIPIMSGVSVPLAWSYASRADVNVLPGSQLRLSIVIDPVRLALRSQ
ncbi:MAG: hypothetical protein SGI92_16050 [Bryobacteraceae bacterium]|nr:hypothetical protein [Bryobacteraceae bacterium]